MERICIAVDKLEGVITNIYDTSHYEAGHLYIVNDGTAMLLVRYNPDGGVDIIPLPERITFEQIQLPEHNKEVLTAIEKLHSNIISKIEQLDWYIKTQISTPSVGEVPLTHEQLATMLLKTFVVAQKPELIEKVNSFEYLLPQE